MQQKKGLILGIPTRRTNWSKISRSGPEREECCELGEAPLSMLLLLRAEAMQRQIGAAVMREPARNREEGGGRGRGLRCGSSLDWPLRCGCRRGLTPLAPSGWNQCV
eukprot:1750427-Rhodomonas_salina.3